MGSNCNPCPPPNKCGTGQSGGGTKVDQGGQSGGGTKVGQSSGGAKGGQSADSGLTPRQDFSQTPTAGRQNAQAVANRPSSNDSYAYLLNIFGSGAGITGETMFGFHQASQRDITRNIDSTYTAPSVLNEASRGNFQPAFERGTKVVQGQPTEYASTDDWMRSFGWGINK